MPAGHVSKGEFLYNWISFPYEGEETYDETTAEWSSTTTNYSLACAMQVGGVSSMVMNFEGSGDLFWESTTRDNYQNTMENQNEEDRADDDDDDNDDDDTT